MVSLYLHFSILTQQLSQECIIQCGEVIYKGLVYTKVLLLNQWELGVARGKSLE